MAKFEKEGTKKLQDAIEGELSDLFDELSAMFGDDAVYSTYSGKLDGMDGDVKFIIETDSIGEDD